MGMYIDGSRMYGSSRVQSFEDLSPRHQELIDREISRVTPSAPDADCLGRAVFNRMLDQTWSDETVMAALKAGPDIIALRSLQCDTKGQKE